MTRTISIPGSPTALERLQHAKALLCVSVDPWLPPFGGQGTFARHLMLALQADLAVVSTCTEALPEGRWMVREFAGIPFAYFNLGSLRPGCAAKKPLIPDRISVLIRAARHMAAVHSSGVGNIFIDDPELLIPASRFQWASSCYNVAGGFNPVRLSRYPILRPLAGISERIIIGALHRMKPETVFVAGDQNLINELGTKLAPLRVAPLPTRVDLTQFYPEPKSDARDRLRLPATAVVLACVGRLCWIKGWDILLPSVRVLKAAGHDALLMFVGDGEDRGKIIAQAEALGIADSVRITGFVPQRTVRDCLNAADVCVIGSYSEGWSVAVLEALACGKAIVSTYVSGAAEMITEGRNGYIVARRDPELYATAIRNATHLPDAAAVSREIAARYSVSGLAGELRKQWSALQCSPKRESPPESTSTALTAAD